MFSSKNIIPSITVIIVLFIIFNSTIPTTVKVVFALFSIAFLIPTVREVMFENKLRKFKVAFYTSLIFSLGLIVLPDPRILISFDISYLFGILFVFFYSSLGIFSYGIPASIVAELVSRKSLKYRSFLSGLIHIGFGLFTGIIAVFSDLIEPRFFVIPTICSVIFFLLDEFTRRKI